MADGQVYELGINESVPIRKGWLTRSFVVYAGMPNESTYSLAVTYTSAHNSVGYNLFIPKSQHEVKLIRGRLVVLRVSPTAISFRIEGREKSIGSPTL